MYFKAKKLVGSFVLKKINIYKTIKTRKSTKSIKIKYKNCTNSSNLKTASIYKTVIKTRKSTMSIKIKYKNCTNSSNLKTASIYKTIKTRKSTMSIKSSIKIVQILQI